MEALRVLFSSEVRTFTFQAGLKCIRWMGITSTGLLWALIKTKGVTLCVPIFASKTQSHHIYFMINLTRNVDYFQIGSDLNLWFSCKD